MITVPELLRYGRYLSGPWLVVANLFTVVGLVTDGATSIILVGAAVVLILLNIRNACRQARLDQPCR